MSRRSLGAQLRILLDEFRLESSVIRHKLSDKHILKSLLELLLIIFIVFLLANIVSFLYTNPDRLLSSVDNAGVFGPLLIIALIILEVVVAPLPGFVVMVAAGYIYGPILGALFSYIGNVLGSLIAFWLARSFGRPFVQRIVTHRALLKYDGFFNRNRRYLLVFYMLPVIPVDILSFICGLSKMSIRRFAFIILIGFIPNTLILSLVGDHLNQLDFVASLLYSLLFLVVFGLLTWLFHFAVNRLQPRQKDF